MAHERTIHNSSHLLQKTKNKMSAEKSKRGLLSPEKRKVTVVPHHGGTKRGR